MDQDTVNALIIVGGLRAKSPIRKKCEKLIKNYVKSAVDLRLIIAVINAHIGVKKTDKAFLAEIDQYNKPMLLVLNKADKTPNEDTLKEAVHSSITAVRDLQNVLPSVHVVSTKTGFGIGELGRYLSTLFLFTEEEELAAKKLEQLADYSTPHKPLLIAQ